ncbi:hypothetical protein LUX33_01560 [Actinomadura madurae]|uniref:hypothetical protein n=1 Tax=Actinomadura madurae TaxID=1993 RepID=UPI0020D2473A|nr:hypothetical protein [Actinomadura madurae]MCP9947281.1 hypothetical protein [Actinomadura madurae]
MAEHDGGSVGIDILPKINAAEWGQEIQRRLDPVLNRAGERGGAVYGSAFKREAEKRLKNISATVRATLDDSSVTRVRERLAKIGPVTAAVAPKIDEVALLRVQQRLAKIGPVRLVVNPYLDEVALQRIQQRGRLGPIKVTIFPKIDEWALLRVQRRLAALGPVKVTIQAEADTARASAELARLQAQIRLLSRSNVRVNVTANTAGAARGLMMLGIQMAALAAIPLGATLAAGIGSIAAAATAAAAGVGGILAVAIPGVRRISEALQAQKTADNQVATSTRGRTVALNSSAIATQQARLQAMQMAQAERQVTQAQQAARQAQADLNRARQEGARSLQDMQNNLISAGLALRGDELAVERARRELEKLGSTRKDDLAVQKAQVALAAVQAKQAKVEGDVRSTQLQKDQAKLAVDLADEALRKAQEQRRDRALDRKEAQLAYEQAVQQLKEQRILVNRLQADEAKARKAGVEGTQEVVQAKQRLKDALEQVADAQRNVRVQQIQDRIAALQEADARRQAAQAADGASAATVRLGRAMDKLTPAEKRLLNAWESFRRVYRGWVNDLEPDVLPVLSGGLGLVAGQLSKFSPMIRSSSAAFKILEARAAVALDGPFWTNFINNLSIVAPEAILRFGGIAGNTLEGVAGIFNAFLPFTNLLLGGVERLTDRFAQWGTSLGGSTGFISFIAYVQETGPQVVSTIGSLGSAILSVGQALAPLASIQLGVISALADGLARLASSHPGLIQVAAAALLVSKAIQVLGITSLIAGLTGSAAAAGAAGGAMLRLGVLLRGLGAALMGVSAQAATTRTVLLGLGKAAGILLAFYAATEAINRFAGSADDAEPSADQLKQSLIDLGRTGQTTSPLLKQFSDGLGDMNEQARILTDPTTSEQAAQFFSGLINGLYGANGIAGQAKDNFKEIDKALVGLAQSGNADVAKASFERLSASLRENGRDVNQINSLFPLYTQQLYYGGGARPRSPRRSSGRTRRC